MKVRDPSAQKAGVCLVKQKRAWLVLETKRRGGAGGGGRKPMSGRDLGALLRIWN